MHRQVVAFVKGTRSAPQCGFSHKMLSILNDMRTDYEVVNVLDEFHNPGAQPMCELPAAAA
jgi:glutaredoxin-related protein